jgi:hypothetical protein
VLSGESRESQGQVQLVIGPVPFTTTLGVDQFADLVEDAYLALAGFKIAEPWRRTFFPVIWHYQLALR